MNIRHGLVALGMALALAGSAAAAPSKPTTDEGLRRGYATARVCFVANGHFYHLFKKAGDDANMRLFDERGRMAFDIAHLWGRWLGLTQQQVNADIDSSAKTELPKLVRDSGYLTSVAASCKSAGFM